MNADARINDYVYNAIGEIIFEPGDLVIIQGLDKTCAWVTLTGQKHPYFVQLANLDILT